MQSLIFLRSLYGFLLLGCFFIFIGCEKTTQIVTPITDNSILTNPAVQPKVILTNPVDGGVGPFNLFAPGRNYAKPYFFIQFNKLMDISTFNSRAVSVEGFGYSVTAYPQILFYSGPSSYTDIVGFFVYRVSSYSSDRVLYPIGKKITVKIDSSVQDVNGNHLATPYSFTFTPEPFFRTVEFSPQDNDTIAPSYFTTTVVFNNDVNSTIFSSLHFSPSINGRWNMSGIPSYEAVFTPTSSLPFSSQYTITVDQNARDVVGNPIHVSAQSHFFTSPFTIISSDPSDGSTNNSLGSLIAVNFSGRMDTASVHSAYSISPVTNGNFSFGYSQLIFQPSRGLLPGTIYTVTIGNTARAYDGTVIAQPFTFSFSTQPFEISSTYPNDGDIGVSKQSYITVNFQCGIDTSTISSAFTIQPAVAGTFSSYYNSSFQFLHTEPFSGNTVYTVRISKALKTYSGGNLPEDYIFSFTTEP